MLKMIYLILIIISCNYYCFRVLETLSYFDNFVPSKEYGIPVFCPTHNALKHLQELLKSSANRINIYNTDKVYIL